MGQIGALTERYQQLCGQLNVGIYRAETLQLRRTSYTTGRLVPDYAAREYDDHEWPRRQLPPIDRRNEDNSGMPDVNLELARGTDGTSYPPLVRHRHPAEPVL